MKINIKKITYLLILILLIAYLLWEGFWYTKVGLSCIKWHSHIMLFLTPLVLIILFNDWKNRKPSKLNVSLFLLFFTLFIWESFLTFSGINKTEFEKQFGYTIERNSLEGFHNYYHINYPNQKIQIKKTEFIFSRTTNDLGYSDYKIRPRLTRKEVRILCLGDSFTEGDGAPFNKSYVFQLRDKLLRPYKYYVFNAGKCGSDPFFNFVNYRDILKKYEFDIVLQTLSSSDIEDDINKRGGMERFKKKYSVEYRKPNSTLKHIYVMSYVGRSFLEFLGFNELFVTKNRTSEDSKKTIELMNQYYLFTKKYNSKLVLVILPNKKEVEEDYPLFFKKTIETIKKNKEIHIIDLRIYYRNELAKNSENFINKNWWEEDWHHTPKGYKMMAEGIYSSLKKSRVVH